jgi:hypothetical protein
MTKQLWQSNDIVFNNNQKIQLKTDSFKRIIETNMSIL